MYYSWKYFVIDVWCKKSVIIKLDWLVHSNQQQLNTCFHNNIYESAIDELSSVTVMSFIVVKWYKGLA